MLLQGQKIHGHKDSRFKWVIAPETALKYGLHEQYNWLLSYKRGPFRNALEDIPFWQSLSRSP